MRLREASEAGRGDDGEKGEGMGWDGGEGMSGCETRPMESVKLCGVKLSTECVPKYGAVGSRGFSCAERAE